MYYQYITQSLADILKRGERFRQNVCMFLFLFFLFSLLTDLDESYVQQYSEIENFYFLFFIVLLPLIHKEISKTE